ncbi:ABC transporter ATP-binding protein [bacterium]|nr:ABC transporter ATP-binding protein [bacterium]
MRGSIGPDTGSVPPQPPGVLLAWLWGRMGPHKKLLIALFLAIGGMVLVEVLRPLVIQRLVDGPLSHLGVSPDEIAETSQKAIQMGLVYLGLVLISFWFSWWSTGSLGRLAHKVMFEMRRDLFAHVVNLKPAFFQRTPVGVLVHRISNDVRAASDLFTQVLNTAVRDLLLILGVLIAMFRMSPILAMWVLTPLPLLLMTTPAFGRWIFRLFDVIRNRSTQMVISLNEILRGLGLLRAYDREGEAEEKYLALNEKTYQAHMESIRAFSLFDPAISLCRYVSVAMLLWKGIPSIHTEALSLGVFIALLAYIRTLYQPLQDLAHKFHLVQSALAGVGKVHWLISVNEPDYQGGTGKSPWPMEGGLLVKNLSFSYTEGTRVVDDLSFNLEKGKKLALVGSTGAGKSTLVKLLMAFYEADEGEISVGGVDQREAGTEGWRGGLAYLSQEVTLFNRSVLDNVRLHDEISADRVEEILGHLGALERFQSLPQALDTVLAEGGKDLSLGERQLVSIARALAFDPEILIMDEATSSIDPELENLVTEAMDTLLEGRTAILIAHRLSTVRKADEIVVMHEGRVVERGTHSMLMEKKGRYYSLVRLQLAT